MKLSGSPLERFHKSYAKTIGGCWEWKRGKSTYGYGQIWVKDKVLYAHRFSHENLIGRIPKGKLVCHKCDNPACVNPEHLFLGTYQDNTNDMLKKGRKIQPYGDDVAKKLTSKDATSIYKSKKKNQELADQYGVGTTIIRNIRSGKKWKEATKHLREDAMR